MNFSKFRSTKNSLANLNPLDRLGTVLPDLPFPALESMLADFASAFTQENRLVNLQIGDGAIYSGRLLPQSVEGREALSESYRYEVTCLSPDAFIPLNGLLGQGVQIDILTSGSDFGPGAQNGQVTRCGLIIEAQALPSDGGFAKYRLIVESPLTLMRHRTTSRVFQDLSVPDIVETILAEHIAGNTAIGSILKTKFDLTKQYPPRSYCFQYRETEFNFIERLMFEEGIGYRWEHTSGDVASVTFIAFDDPYSLPQAAQGTARFHHTAAVEVEDSLTEWTQARRIGPSSVNLTSYDYKPVHTHAASSQSLVEDTDEDTDEDRENISAEVTVEDFDAQTLHYAPDGGVLYLRRPPVIE
jgi:type VI secretion system secreted protein VgrG